jgi:hypothetical protein
MKCLFRIAVLAAAALAIVAAPNATWAGKRGFNLPGGAQVSGAKGGGGAQGSGAKGGSGAQGSGARGGFRTRFYGGFFVGAPFWYPYYPYPYYYGPYPYYYYGPSPYCYGPRPYCYGPPPYYYGPDYSRPRYDPPTVYVEKFEGAPTPETQGDIFCPDRSAYYPDVKDCPNGWQRVFQASAPAVY